MKKVFVFLMLCSILSLQAQLRNSDIYEITEMNNSHMRNEIHIPDVGGYKTLKSDLHIHAFFSDGKVWPHDKSTLYPVHEEIHGVGVFNHLEYYPGFFDWCEDKNLTFMSNTDIHDLINTAYGTQQNPSHDIRPVQRAKCGKHERGSVCQTKYRLLRRQ